MYTIINQEQELQPSTFLVLFIGAILIITTIIFHLVDLYRKHFTLCAVIILISIALECAAGFIGIPTGYTKYTIEINNDEIKELLSTYTIIEQNTDGTFVITDNPKFKLNR